MSDNNVHIILDTTVFVAETEDEIIEITDGSTHNVAINLLPKLIKRMANSFELTIKTIPHSSEECLVTFKKI